PVAELAVEVAAPAGGGVAHQDRAGMRVAGGDGAGLDGQRNPRRAPRALEGAPRQLAFEDPPPAVDVAAADERAGVGEPQGDLEDLLEARDLRRKLGLRGDAEAELARLVCAPAGQPFRGLDPAGMPIAGGQPGRREEVASRAAAGAAVAHVATRAAVARLATRAAMPRVATRAAMPRVATRAAM